MALPLERLVDVRRRELLSALRRSVLGSRRDDALSIYAQLCELEPSEPRWQRARGDLLLRLGRADEAASAYQIAIGLHRVSGRQPPPTLAVMLEVARSSPGTIEAPSPEPTDDGEVDAVLAIAEAVESSAPPPPTEDDLVSGFHVVPPRHAEDTDAERWSFSEIGVCDALDRSLELERRQLATAPTEAEAAVETLAEAAARRTPWFRLDADPPGRFLTGDLALDLDPDEPGMFVEGLGEEIIPLDDDDLLPL